MRTDERAEFLRAWQQVASGLAAISALLDELPETMRPELLQLLHNLKSSQLRRYREVEQLPPIPMGGLALVEDAIEQQRVLAREVANFIDHARVECERARVRGSTALVPATSRRGDGDSHDLRSFRHEVSVALDELQSAGRSAGSPQALPVPYRSSPPPAGAAALCAMCHQPVQAVYLAAAPPAQMKLLGGPARPIAGNEGGHDADVRDARKRGSQASARRQTAAESLAASVVKAIGGTGMLLAVAVIVAAVALRSTRPTGQPVTHEQHDMDDTRMAAEDSASSAAGMQEKPFADRLELVPTSVAAATRAPSAAPPPTAIATGHDGAAFGAAPSSRVGATKPVATLEAREIERTDRGVRAQRPQAKSVAKATGAPVAGASPPSLHKVAAVPTPRPPVNVMRADAKPPAAESIDTGDGLYVAVLSTHKQASAAREVFAELQKKYATVLGSKQSEVQVTSGQAGSWHRLVATPASTKAAASQICSDLRSAGYGRCWVKPY